MNKLGEYEILETLGEGGAATVYLARTPGGNEVALKKLKIKPDAKDIERFMREAGTMAAMVHPHLVQLHSIKIVDGIPLLELEYMSGGDLADLIKQGPLEVDKAIDVIQQMLEGIAAIHERGKIHRDIKPLNILRQDPNSWVFKIADFGIAVETVGQPTMQAGTVWYVPPEVLEPPHQFDKRLDLYAAGITAFQVLLGMNTFRLAFKEILGDGGPVGDSRWMNWVRDPAEQAPSVTTFRAEIPQHVADVVSKLMHKDRDQRFGSAEEALAALRGPAANLTPPQPVAPVEPPTRMMPQPAAAAPAQPKKKSKGLLYAGVAASALVFLLLLFMTLAKSQPAFIEGVVIETTPETAVIVWPKGTATTPHTFAKLKIAKQRNLTFSHPGYLDTTVPLNLVADQKVYSFELEPDCAAPATADGSGVGPARVAFEGFDLQRLTETAKALPFVKVIAPTCATHEGKVELSDNGLQVLVDGTPLARPIESKGEAALAALRPRLETVQLLHMLQAPANSGTAKATLGLSLKQSDEPTELTTVRVGEHLSYWVQVPDGQRLLVLDVSPEGQLYIVHPRGGEARELEHDTWVRLATAGVGPPMGRDRVVALTYSDDSALAALEERYPKVFRAEDTRAQALAFARASDVGESEAIRFARDLSVAMLADTAWARTQLTYEIQR